MMTVKEFALKYGVSERRVQVLIKQGRIPAKKMYGGRYFLDTNAVYPIDQRYTGFWHLPHQRKPINKK